MQFLDHFLAQRLLSLFDDEVVASEMVGCLDDVIHVEWHFVGHSNGVCLKDVASLVVSQPTSLNMVAVEGQVNLHLVIDAAFQLHLLLLPQRFQKIVLCHHFNRFGSKDRYFMRRRFLLRYLI